MKESKYFYCYSWPLKEFFLKNGLRYIAAGNNLKTNKRYWLFESNEEITRLLEIWRANR